MRTGQDNATQVLSTQRYAQAVVIPPGENKGWRWVKPEPHPWTAAGSFPAAPLACLGPVGPPLFLRGPFTLTPPLTPLRSWANTLSHAGEHSGTGVMPGDRPVTGSVRPRQSVRTRRCWSGSATSGLALCLLSPAVRVLDSAIPIPRDKCLLHRVVARREELSRVKYRWHLRIQQELGTCWLSHRRCRNGVPLVGPQVR